MSKKESEAVPVTPIHQWTNEDGEVLILRYSDSEGRSYGRFQHPMQIGETVTAGDWNNKPVCGGGIHGWPWGIGLGDGKEPDWSALWQVYGVKPEDIVAEVDGGPKIKFRTGILRYKGDWHNASLFILSGQMKWTVHASRGAATNSGDSGAATNSGDRGAAISTGPYSSSETSASGTAAVVTGLNGRARAAEFGCIALAWWNEKERRVEMRCALVGDKIKANTWHRLNDAGEFVEDK